MIVVSDTSCIGYLLMIDSLRFLKDNFNQIIIPEAVRSELLNLSSKYNVKRFLDERWVEVMSIHQRHFHRPIFGNKYNWDIRCFVIIKKERHNIIRSSGFK